jgi:hypothetical protein
MFFLLTWVQNGPVGFEKNLTHKKTIYVLNDDYIVSVGLIWTNGKIGKIVSLYQREMLKKIPGLGTFFTQSDNQGLNIMQHVLSLFTVIQKKQSRSHKESVLYTLFVQSVLYMLFVQSVLYMLFVQSVLYTLFVQSVLYTLFVQSVTGYCYSSMFEAISHDCEGVLFQKHVTRDFINKSGG